LLPKDSNRCPHILFSGSQVQIAPINHVKINLAYNYWRYI